MISPPLVAATAHARAPTSHPPVSVFDFEWLLGTENRIAPSVGNGVEPYCLMSSVRQQGRVAVCLSILFRGLTSRTRRYDVSR